jgi:DNA polymerase III delta prime subunit
MNDLSAAGLRRTITDAHREGRLPRTLLLVGRTPDVLERFATSIAAILLQNDYPFRGPDFFPIRPIGKSRQITAECTREVRSRIQRSASGSGARVVLIIGAERLNRSAANILLKSLEEPPPNVFFLLTSVRPDDILPTVYSRCTIHRLKEEGSIMLPEPILGWLEKLYYHVEDAWANAQPHSVPMAYSLIGELRNILNAEENDDGRRVLLEEIFSRLAQKLLRTATAHFPISAEDRRIAVHRLARWIRTIAQSSWLMSMNWPEEVILEYCLLPPEV